MTLPDPVTVGNVRPAVHFWAADWAGCGFYRCQEPARVLGMLGYRTTVDTIITESWTAGTVVGQRISQPHPSRRWRRLARDRDLTGTPRRLVFDVDDDLFALTPGAPAYEFYARPEVRAQLAENASLADVITCASEPIAARMAEFGPTVVIPNGLPAELLSWPRLARRPDADVVIGWVGSSSSEPDLAVAAAGIRRVLDRNPRWRLHTIGATVAAVERAGLAHPQVDVTEWVPGTLDYLRRVDFDVWVAPLRDTAFNRAKFPTKVMESAILGVPLVCSPVGEYAAGGTDRMHAVEAHEWQRWLWRLGSDLSFRERAIARQRAAAPLWITERLGPAWIDVLGLADT